MSAAMALRASTLDRWLMEKVSAARCSGSRGGRVQKYGRQSERIDDADTSDDLSIIQVLGQDRRTARDDGRFDHHRIPDG